MSSKRFRALRNRQDRTRVKEQIMKEVNETSMDNVNKEEMMQDTSMDNSKKEPELDLASTVKASEAAAPTSTASDAFTQGMSAVEDKEILNNEIPEEMVLSPVEQARAAIKDNFAATSNEEENLTLSQVTEAPKAPTQEDADEESTVEDPDKVPVATTLTDDQVPNRPGAILMHAREILGLSLREVSTKLHLRINTVSDIEHDRLNQVTAVPFTSIHIANYAKLVNIDPNYLVDLYKECVNTSVQEKAILNTNVKQNTKAETSTTTSKSPLLKIVGGLVAVLAIVAVSVGGTIAFMSSSDEDSTGSLVIEDTVESLQDNSGNLTLDTENSKKKTNIVEEEPMQTVDINTQMAQEQANTLDTNAIIASQNESQNVEDVEDAPLALNVKGKEMPQAQVTNAKEEIDVAPVENSLQSVTLNAPASKATAKQNSKATVTTTQVKSTAKETAPTVQSTSEVVTVTIEPEKKVQTPAPKAEVKVALVSNPRDVSQSVRLQGKRDPFESLNTVKVRVLGDVALKITGNGKTLKQGSYKAGETITASGIPPIKVSVSDSTKVRVSYLGTTVAVPSSKQVSFTLPTR